MQKKLSSVRRSQIRRAAELKEARKAVAIHIPTGLPEISPRKLAALREKGLVEEKKYVAETTETLERLNTVVIPPPIKTVEHKQNILNLSFAARQRIMAILAERNRRRNEALRLWVPMDVQRDFHNCTAYERTVIGSNRSGKTTCAAVEAALVFTGTHPVLSGKRVKKEGGNAAIVGFDWDHIGRVLYKKLFVQGAFRIIRDEATNKWRPFVADTDGHRKSESKDAPPLIPKRMIKKIAWKSKSLSQPKQVVLTNGWVLHFFSSEGEPPQGDPFDYVWFDEEIQNSKWYTEIVMRLADTDGFFVWSATPHVGGDDLIDLHNRSVEQLTAKHPTTREFVLTLFGNKHIAEEAKQRVVEKFKNNPEAYRVRVLGEFAVKAFKIYSEYSPSIHNFDPKKVWEKTGGQVPADWCKYIAVDPGRTVCALNFLAVPPPELGENWYVYKELHIEQCNPEKFALEVEAATRNQSFECFIMDMQAGRSRQTSGGRSVEEQYHEALLEVGKDRVNVWKRFRQSFFWPGAADLKAGIDEVKTCLFIDTIHGVPRLLLAKDMLPHTEQEFDRYQWAKVDGRITDKPRDKWHHHLDCFDAETEVLTDGGWRLFRDLRGTEALATVNLEKDEIQYQIPSELIARPHDGDVVEFGGIKMNAVVTPNHRMVVVQKKRTKVKIREAGSLTRCDRIKLHAANWNGDSSPVLIHKLKMKTKTSGTKKIDAGDFAELLGWFAAEGCLGKPQCPGRGYQTIISQTKKQGREKLERCLNSLPWKWRYNGSDYVCSDRQLWEYLKRELPGKCHEKRVPNWIKQASQEIIIRFLAGSIEGDGWVQGGASTICTTSKLMADDLQELFIKAGVSASVSIGKRAGNISYIRGRKVVQKLDQYWVREWRTPYGCLANSKGKSNFRRRHYRGMVYCATVPNSTLIVRRHGKPMIAGNCIRYLCCFRPPWAQPKPVDRPKSAAVKRFLEKKKKAAAERSGGVLNFGPGKRVLQRA